MKRKIMCIIFVGMLLTVSFTAAAALKVNTEKKYNENDTETQPLDTSGVIRFKKRIIKPDSFQYGYSVQQTNDGGYIVVGEKKNPVFGTSNIWLLKFDKYGNIVTWENNIFGGDNIANSYSVQQTSDGGYIIAGCIYSSNAGSYDAYIIKTNSIGNLLVNGWSTEIDINSNSFDIAFSVKQIYDGYIVTGVTGSEIEDGPGYNYETFLIKLNDYGNVVWKKTYPADYQSDNPEDKIWSDYRTTIQQTFDSDGTPDGFIFNSKDCLIGTDLQGEVKYRLTYDIDRQCNSVQQTKDGGFITGVGHYLVKYDNDGDLDWKKEIISSFGVIRDVKQTFDSEGEPDGFIIAFDDQDCQLIKTNSDGEVLWTRSYTERSDTTIPIFFYGESVQQTSDGGYVLTGGTFNDLDPGNYDGDNIDLYLIKTDSNGKYVLTKSKTMMTLFLMKIIQLFPELKLLLNNLLK